jgi:septum formation protein
VQEEEDRRGAQEVQEEGAEAPGLILASGSPQRRALLDALGVEFEVVVPEVEELGEGDPRELVERNALAKARAVAPSAPGATVIGGDTEVVLDGEALGQPADEAAARGHLARLSGRTHEVLGGLAVLGPEGDGEGAPRERSGVAASTVGFRELDAAMIDAYLASGEWRGRAGGYAVQGLGSALVDSVSGDLSNVIGLPVPLLAELAPELFAQSGRLY